ncbi:MAG: hypothetical protein IPK11_15845 [Ignavibacteria bacterium]|nr:hypothetical protein [Ignavibacteria bacterium]
MHRTTQSWCEYYADSKDDILFIMTNDNAKNFKIMQTTIENPSINSWQKFGHIMKINDCNG